ncbi:MAG: phage holin family protein [Methanocella sp.]
MGAPDSPEKPLSIESEFANLVRYIDLYIRQKTDLYIQHYVLDPFDFLVRQIIYLSVLAALLVSGTLALLIGIILFISTMVPLWEALLIMGIVAFVIAALIAYVLFSRKLVLKTPTTEDVMKNGRP